MKKLMDSLYVLAILLTLALGVSAQSLPAKVVEKPAVETAKPVALSAEQMRQLADAQKLIELAETRASEARAQLEKLQAQVAAMVADFRWQLGLTPKEFEPQLKLLDQQTGALGFVPLAKK